MKGSCYVSNSANQTGYALIAVMIVMILSLFALGGTLSLTAGNGRSYRAMEIRADDYFQAEQSLNRALSWLRENSQKFATPYRRDEFYTRFTKTGPSYGDNETSSYKVATKIKLAGTSTSAILVTDNELANSAFPQTRDIVANTVFPAQSEFQAADTGSALVRITLVDAIADDPSKDYGPPPNATPETDFFPIYQIDSMTDTSSGAHVYGTVRTDLNHLFDYGIYGESYLELRQACDSYNSGVGAYGNASKRANCPASSNSTSEIHKSEVVYGTLRTNGNINEENPYGGKVCADFTANCPNRGEKCSGEDCGVPLLERFSPWNIYCPQSQGDVTITGDQTLTVTGNAPNQRCWNRVIVQTNSKLTLTSTANPYYIETLELQNNSNSRIDIQPNPAGKIVTLYINNLVGNAINGNQTINTGRPFNFRLFYLGSADLTLNGTADMRVALVAPNATVAVGGSFQYFGALLANRLTLNGSGDVHYDESLGGGGDVNDTQYKLKDLVQYYR